MRLARRLRQLPWPTVCGYGLFVGMMAAGYYYNITFVQLGLPDLATRLIGLPEAAVARSMALLAVLACAVALLTGWTMQRRGWGAQLVVKLRLAFAVVSVQVVLTAAAPFLRSEGALLAWVALASLTLGVGMPATFSMASDLILVRHRGMVAALITAGAYVAGATLAAPWRIERFAAQMLGPLLGGAIVMGVLAFLPWPWVASLAAQHRDPAFGRGRFVIADGGGRPRVRRGLLGLIALMFGIFFVDSLGFLRLIHTPVYMESAWLAPDLAPRLAIAGAHALAALVAGILYAALDERALFFWIFGLFALVELMYVADLRVSPLLPGTGPTLAMPLLYAVAVSLYTVVNFAVWADCSTPATIGRNTAAGVALSGWVATFLSTALAVWWRQGVSLDRHLSTVAAIALLGLTALLAASFLRTPPAPTHPRSKP